MARPFKSGIDYYAHVIGMYEDDKFLDIREEFGLLGLGIVTKLLENIYNNGYYLKWNDKIERNFSMTNRVDRKTVTKCIEYLTGDIPNGSGDIEDYFLNKILSPTFIWILTIAPLSSVFPGPTAITSPVCGFSAPVSGRIIPPIADSFFIGFTIRWSDKGFRFIMFLRFS